MGGSDSKEVRDRGDAVSGLHKYDATLWSEPSPESFSRPIKHPSYELDYSDPQPTITMSGCTLLDLLEEPILDITRYLSDEALAAGAAFGGSSASASRLGVNLEDVDSCGKPPLVIALTWDSFGAIKALVAAGSDTATGSPLQPYTLLWTGKRLPELRCTAAPNGGRYVLEYASEHGLTDVVRALLKHGVRTDPDKEDFPFLGAARGSHIKVVKLLMAAGSDPSTA
ncbi:hypothetical protein BJX70DRAFT_401371 [Aspergillus crustosus]